MSSKLGPRSPKTKVMVSNPAWGNLFGVNDNNPLTSWGLLILRNCDLQEDGISND